MEELPYIGPYLAERFENFSIWDNHRYPIRSLEDLYNFCLTRRMTLDVKTKMRAWLSLIMLNARGSDCVPRGREHNGRLTLYNVRLINRQGFNSVVDFLKLVLPFDRHRMIPSRKRWRKFSTRYPIRCRE